MYRGVVFDFFIKYCNLWPESKSAGLSADITIKKEQNMATHGTNLRPCSREQLITL